MLLILCIKFLVFVSNRNTRLNKSIMMMMLFSADRVACTRDSIRGRCMLRHMQKLREKRNKSMDVCFVFVFSKRIFDGCSSGAQFLNATRVRFYGVINDRLRRLTNMQSVSTVSSFERSFIVIYFFLFQDNQNLRNVLCHVFNLSIFITFLSTLCFSPSHLNNLIIQSIVDSIERRNK